MPGLLIDDSETRAQHYAEAANKLEKAVRLVSDAEDHIDRIPEESERAGEISDVVDQLDGLWYECRLAEADHSSKEVETPDPDETARKRAQAEAERLPDDYEPTPLPELDVIGFEGFGGDSVRLHVRLTDERHVEDRHGNTARQWIARVPSVRSRRHCEYNWVNFDGDSHDFAVEAGSVVVIGSKRHDRCRTQEFYAVTGDDQLERLGTGEEGRAEAKAFLDQQEGER